MILGAVLRAWLLPGIATSLAITSRGGVLSPVRAVRFGNRL